MANARLPGNHIDAVDRAGFNAEITAGAFVGDHGMHDFRRAQDRIDGTGLNAFSAADALCFSDVGDQRLFLGTVLGIEWFGFDIKQVGQRLNGVLAARGTFVDRITVSNGLGIRATTGITALAALRLGQYGIDLIAERVALDLKLDRRESEQTTEHNTHAHDRSECEQNR